MWGKSRRGCRNGEDFKESHRPFQIFIEILHLETRLNIRLNGSPAIYGVNVSSFGRALVTGRLLDEGGDRKAIFTEDVHVFNVVSNKVNEFTIAKNRA